MTTEKAIWNICYAAALIDWVLAWGFIVGAVVSIIVISNPISTSAIFIAVTEEMTHDERRAVARRSIRYSAGILLFFAFTGLLLFQLFGFGIGAFRIAGGVLLFTTAVSMLNPKGREEQAEEQSQDIAIIPLAIPFTAGPGTITTVVVLMSEAIHLHDGEGWGTAILAGCGVFIGIFANLLISYQMMIRSEDIDERLGTGRKVLTRLMGLIVMAIAIQFIINGVKDILPEFIEIADQAKDAIIALF